MDLTRISQEHRKLRLFTIWDKMGQRSPEDEGPGRLRPRVEELFKNELSEKTQVEPPANSESFNLIFEISPGT